MGYNLIDVPRFNKKENSRKASACRSLLQLDFKSPEEIEDTFEMVYETPKYKAPHRIVYIYHTKANRNGQD